mmetsp:Transcript_89432/g.163868  ORF Transcript_89432/g.163868 Transcript_89432/m.163868 type:complete len:464 (+) Transcript_89432:70-1461(+)
MFDWEDLDEDEPAGGTSLPDKKQVDEDVPAKLEIPEPMAEPMAVADIQNSSLQPVPERQADHCEPPAAEPMVEPVSECTAKTETQSKACVEQDRATASGDFRQLPPAALTELYSQFAEKKQQTAVPQQVSDQAAISQQVIYREEAAYSVEELASEPRDENAKQHPPERRDTEAVDASEGLLRRLSHKLGGPIFQLVTKCIGLIYQFVTLLFYQWALFFHAYDVIDLHKLPPDAGGLIVVIHSSHNADILTLVSMIYTKTGRAPSMLLYGRLSQFLPFLKILGFAFSSAEVAVEVLRKGSLTVIAPGGVAEALRGHENAYSLHPNWEACTSYARMAKEAGVKIYPCFTQNADEMRFNPFFWLANKFWLGKIYDVLSNVPVLGLVAKFKAMQLWFPTCWTAGLPVPVKLTTYFGEPVETDGLSEEQIAKATKAAMASLVNQYQPHGHAYLPGLRSRLAVPAKKSL